MAKLDIKRLEVKTREELLLIINDVASSVKGASDYINLNYLLTPEKKAKLLTTEYGKFKRSKRFYDYYETIGFCQELIEEVLEPAKKMATDAPLEVANLAQVVIDDFEKLLANKDDSSGCGMDLLYAATELWGYAWTLVPNRDYIKLATLVADYFQFHSYLSLEIFDYFKLALGKQGFAELENLLANNKRGLFHVLGLMNNPDKYIQAIEAHNCYDVEYILKLAEMLIEDLRSDEAINWLIKYVPEKIADERLYRSRQDLLIRAYHDEGNQLEVINQRWEAFKRTLSSKYYLDLMRMLSQEQQSTYREEMLQLLAERTTFIGAVWAFLDDVEEYQVLSESIIKNNQKVCGVNVTPIRKLSKTLAANGFPLAAVVIRRELINYVLGEAKSKYYDYAVSDLKLCFEYGTQVLDWQEFEDNDSYLFELKTRHAKKYAFWGKVEDAVR